MFGSPGKEEGCLWFPRKVVVMKNTTGNFVVCDRGCERSRMQIFSPQVLNISIFIREKYLYSRLNLYDTTIQQTKFYIIGAFHTQNCHKIH